MIWTKFKKEVPSTWPVYKDNIETLCQIGVDKYVVLYWSTIMLDWCYYNGQDYIHLGDAFPFNRNVSRWCYLQELINNSDKE